MSKRSILSAFVFFVISLLVFSACENDNNGVSSDINTNVDGAEFAVLDYNDAVNAFIDPDLENGPRFGDFPGDPIELMGNGHDGRMGNMQGGLGNMGPEDGGLHLGRVLRAMELTETQLTEIESLMSAHRETMQALFEAFKEASTEIMAYGREQHQIIKDQVQDGTITREEARRLMHALGEEIREMLATDETTSTIREQMCAARDELFVSIAILLTAEQLDIWNRWVENHPGRC